MRVVVLYHPDSEQTGKVQDYIRELELQGKQRSIEPVSLESKRGAELAEVYDVTNYPAVLVIADDGQLLKLWQTGDMPLINDLDFYLTR